MRTRALTVPAVVGLALVMLPALPASAKGLSQSQINSLEKNLNNAKKLTYQVTYSQVDGGKTTTVTIAQASGKSNFTTGDGSSVINTGKKTYYCSANSSSNSGSTGNSGNSGNSGSTTTTTKAGSLQCVTTSGANPLLGFENAFSAAPLTALLNESKASAVARALGIKVTTSTQNFAGQQATCLSATVHGNTGKYCVTKQGILAYVGTGNGTYFKMTKYSSKPSSSLFKLPAGATTKTIPSTPSVP